MAEPVAHSLRRRYDRITLYTDYMAVGLLLESIDEVKPYSQRPEQANLPAEDRAIGLLYETMPSVNHLDGFAISAGVTLTYRVPRLKRGAPKIVEGYYGVVAPRTSHWIQSMRQWSMTQFVVLRQMLAEYTRVPVVMLEEQHSFAEMISLLEHCAFFVGNDSGPAILAQCFDAKAFVIFGATNPKLVLLNPHARFIQNDIGCNGCIHSRRHNELLCASPMCLTDLSVNKVFEEVMAGIGLG